MLYPVSNCIFHFFSDLTKLIKLHLEQNEIREFKDQNVFCDLPKLLDIYLADNFLDAIHFNISCLHNLRFLNLERNHFRKVRREDMRMLDAFANSHEQKLEIDFNLNPFACSCELNPFAKWMVNTPVVLRNKERLTCKESRELSHFSYSKESNSND